MHQMIPKKAGDNRQQKSLISGKIDLLINVKTGCGCQAI
jgi:hypothetical protein